MSELSDIYSDISGNWSNLQTEWADARGAWRDAVADRFEKEYWDDLEDELPRLLGRLADMDDALEQARHTIDED